MIYQHDCFLNRLFCAVNSTPRVHICTDVCLFDGQDVGVEPTTERIYVMDHSVTL